MIDELYQKNLLRLAANAVGDGTLDNPDATETLDNPTCGDRIAMQVKVSEGRITDLKHQNRSCMLCQASASLIGENAIGKELEEISATRNNLQSMLHGEPVQATSVWKKLEFFNVVSAHKSRHHCVLLPFDALIKALETEKTKA
ncbi:MAG: iron-sulfur cluster assembly scaffold protein [Sneathiella sp.]